MYRYNNYRNFNNGNRFIGGGFIGPFILGGITGGLIANSRPNNTPIFFYPIYYPNQYNQFFY